MAALVRAAGLVASTATALAAAQVPQSATPGDPGREIVVEGRTAGQVDRFVEALTQTYNQRQLARWNGQICPRVLGLDPAHADYIAGRVGAIARQLRIRVGSGRCRGNIVIVVAGEADEFTRLLVARHPRLFRGPRDSLASPGEIAQLRQPRPVRWIAASATGSADGRAMMDGVHALYSASRLTMPTRENATLSIIIVDAAKLQHITWSQLADYLALVALARPAMDAPYDAGTVLSIFHLRDRGGRGPMRLTRQDRAFLRALYATNAATRANVQRSAIRDRMGRDPEPAEAE